MCYSWLNCHFPQILKAEIVTPISRRRRINHLKQNKFYKKLKTRSLFSLKNQNAVVEAFRLRREHCSSPIKPVPSDPWRRNSRSEQMGEPRTRGTAQGIRLQPYSAAGRVVPEVGGLGAALLSHQLSHRNYPRGGPQRQARTDDRDLGPPQSPRKARIGIGPARRIWLKKAYACLLWSC